MAFDLHPIICTWDVVTTCIPVTVFFPLGMRLCSNKKKKKGLQLEREPSLRWSVSMVDKMLRVTCHACCKCIKSDSFALGSLEKKTIEVIN